MVTPSQQLWLAAQDQVSQDPSIDEDDLEDLPLTEELLAMDSCCGGKVILF